MIRFIRARTAAVRNIASRSSMVPSSTNRSRNICWYRLRRIDTAGRSPAPITADNRDPSGSRRSSSGLARVNGRALIEAYAARFCTICTRSSSVAAIGAPRTLPRSA